MDNKKGNICPLLQNPEVYNPDTIDLFKDENERNYWLPTFEKMVKKMISKSKILNPDIPKGTEKAEICYEKFHKLVENLMVNPR